MLILTVIQGPEKGRQFELPDHEPQMIGRSSESLPLSDQTISRRHASLTPDEGKWILEDLKSSNGTFVNGVRLADRRELKPGDQIRCGQTLMVFGQDGRAPRMTVRLASKKEMDVSLEHAMTSSDESMIMASPDPTDAAAFQLKVVYELTGIIGSITDQQELFERVLNLVFEYFQPDRGYILLCESPDDKPRPVMVRHRYEEPGSRKGKTQQVTISRTITRYVLSRKAGVLSSNAMTDKRFAGGDSVQAYVIRSAMCVPIRFKDRLFGVIHIDSRVANYTFTEDQLALMTTIGIQTGLALTNLRQYEARVQNERLAAVGQTVASLSHSIKNIVQGLRGGAEVVELGLRKKNLSVVNGGWEIVARNLDRVSELAMNMLAYAKQRKPEIEYGNMAMLIEEVVLLMQRAFDSKEVALLVDVDNDLPPVPMEGTGIHQALLNLLSNALDAVEPESGVVTLRAWAKPDKGKVFIRVHDNGPGISTEGQKNLFRPFHSTKGLKGTGLGLPVTRKIVEEHSGVIVARSSPKDGTTFRVTLPLHIRSQRSPADTHSPSAS